MAPPVDDELHASAYQMLVDLATADAILSTTSDQRNTSSYHIVDLTATDTIFPSSGEKQGSGEYQPVSIKSTGSSKVVRPPANDQRRTGGYATIDPAVVVGSDIFHPTANEHRRSGAYAAINTNTQQERSAPTRHYRSQLLDDEAAATSVLDADSGWIPL
jgi:hypothetical protein